VARRQKHCHTVESATTALYSPIVDALQENRTGWFQTGGREPADSFEPVGCGGFGRVPDVRRGLTMHMSWLAAGAGGSMARRRLRSVKRRRGSGGATGRRYGVGDPVLCWQASCTPPVKPAPLGFTKAVQSLEATIRDSEVVSPCAHLITNEGVRAHRNKEGLARGASVAVAELPLPAGECGTPRATAPGVLACADANSQRVAGFSTAALPERHSRRAFAGVSTILHRD